MHELAVCQALMREVETVANEHAGSRVTMIYLGIGPLSGVDPALLQQAFPFASAGSCAESATLEIEETPVIVFCERCQQESRVRPARLVCATCKNWRTRLVSGDELQLLRLELDRPTVHGHCGPHRQQAASS